MHTFSTSSLHGPWSVCSQHPLSITVSMCNAIFDDQVIWCTWPNYKSNAFTWTGLQSYKNMLLPMVQMQQMCNHTFWQPYHHTAVFQCEPDYSWVNNMSMAETHDSLFLWDNSLITDCSAFIHQLVMHELYCYEEFNQLLDQHLKSHSRAKSHLLSWIMTTCSTSPLTLTPLTTCSMKQRTLHTHLFSILKTWSGVQPLLWSLGLGCKQFCQQCSWTWRMQFITQTNHMAVTAWGEITQTSSNCWNSTQSNVRGSWEDWNDSAT